MTLSTGCLLEIPLIENQPPTAYIDLIAPSQAPVGQVISFSGHGTDPDGTVVGYRWRSSLDGDLSTVANFQTSSLSVGNHAIYLSVQDNNGARSAEAASQVIIAASQPPPPPPALLPVIVSFGADQAIINQGDSALLSWNVSGATTVSIDPGIGSVALTGSRIISPGGTTTYILTATNSAGSTQASTQIAVRIPAPPEERTTTILPVVNESGYVRDNGDVVPRFIYVGDDNSDFSLQAFISFDISDIPDHATINQVVVDFSDYDQVYGSPFSSLGCLRGYVDDYGSLSSGDFVDNATGSSIIRFCSLPEVNASDSNPDVADALQQAVGDNRFQMRLQFRDTDTDGNHDNDLMAWTSSHLPELIVTYVVPQ